MSILITGATGFIGRHVCALLSQQHDLCAVLRQPDRQLPALRRQVEALGGQGQRLQAIQGDLTLPNLGLPESLPTPAAIIHLAARFAWQLDPAEARQSNVEGSLAVAELARRARCRLVFISGFMLENPLHLQRLGIGSADPEQVDWQRVYRRAGAYEASKLEAAIRVRALAAKGEVELIEVQPATVAAHSETGALDSSQALYELLDNLAHGRLTMVPGSPAHWLPVVAVDTLSALISAAATANTAPARLLALDPNTPNLRDMLGLAARQLNRKAPTRHLPMPLLSALLRLPGLAGLMNTAPEALHFIQTSRFGTAVTEHFMQQQGLSHPPVAQLIATSAQSYRQQTAS